MDKQMLHVWWIPQIPMKAFYIDVKTIREAKLILQTLGEYDDFQYKNNIKPDYSNAGGLEVWDDNSDGEGNPAWVEWYNDDDCNIDEVDDEGNTLEQ
jgi:hypothetical protein